MSSKIFIAGHNGMVGSAILRILKEKKKLKLITRTKKKLDLTDQKKVDHFFKINQIDQVYMCAAKVGGILANINYPVDFLLNNIQIQNNVINACVKHKVKNLIFIGSSCIYPKNIKKKISEDDLLSGRLEETNSAYALAKITGIKLIQSYINQHKLNYNYKILMPCNLYGKNDNFDKVNSHVLAALIRKFSEAKINKYNEIEVWGSGTPRREFMNVDNFAQAAIYFMKKKLKNKKNENFIINIGSGKDLSIKQLAIKLAKNFKYKGRLVFNKRKPDGVKKKLLNVKKAKSLGWKHKENFDYEIKKYLNKEKFFKYYNFN